MPFEPISSPTSRDLGRPSKIAVTLIGGSVDVVAAPHTSTAQLEVTELTGAPLTLDDSSGTLRIEQRKDNTAATEAMNKYGLGMLSGIAGLVGAAVERPVVRLVLTLPDDVAVTVRTVSGDALVGGAHGDVTVQTVSGDVTVDRCTGRVDLTTVSGDVECSSPSGELKVKTVSGDITVQDAVVRSARLNTVSGRSILDLRHGPSLVTSNAVSGEVSVRMPSDAGYDATVSSTSGHVVVDGEPLIEDGKRGGHRYVGDRSIAIKARTVAGDLTVLRRGATSGHAPGTGPVIVESDGPSDIQDHVRGDGPSDGRIGGNGGTAGGLR